MYGLTISRGLNKTKATLVVAYFFYYEDKQHLCKSGFSYIFLYRCCL